jgi:hypothetical protein
VIVDGGSILTRRSHAREMVDDTTLTGMERMGYAAATLGQYDLYNGVEYLMDRMEGKDLPLVSANVMDESTGELLVKPYVIVERHGVKFGITGVVDPAKTTEAQRGPEMPGVTVGNPVAALQEVVPKLREKVDFVVVLSQLGLTQSKDVPLQVPGIDFIVVGAQNTQSTKPYEVEGTVFLQPGQRGQYMCDYRLSFDETGAYTGYTGTTVTLDDSVPADASIALLLKEHKVEVSMLQKQTAAQRAGGRMTDAAPATYQESCIGTEGSCRRCHVKEYDHWSTTAHAHAFMTLEKGLQSTNPECLRCHSTCYIDLPADGSVAVATELRNVQCEACHGMGTDHARDGSYGAISAQTCLVCHDKENSPDFDLATYLPKVRH